MTTKMQVSLLRILTNKRFQRVGGEEELISDVRVLAASNRDLQHEVKEGHFREDLYYRLCGHPVKLPAFRELSDDDRAEKVKAILKAVFRVQPPHDISSAESGLDLFFSQVEEIDVAALPISRDAMERIVNHPMPGNYRQLHRLINNAWLKTGKRIEVEHLAAELLATGTEPVVTHANPDESLMRLPWKEFEVGLQTRNENLKKEKINCYLKDNRNFVTKASAAMGISRDSLERKMKKLGMPIPRGYNKA
jgi:DNA-binding NtrC family response regulator